MVSLNGAIQNNSIVYLGTGNDTVYLNPNGAVNNVLVQSASGDNYVFLGNASNATGSVEVTLGTGDDTIYVEGLNSQGSIDLGSGSDSFNVLDNSISGLRFRAVMELTLLPSLEMLTQLIPSSKM